MPQKAIVIGAGLGGLSAASLLAVRGWEVSLFEKNSTPGGKMQQWQSGGYRFDTGPSLLTMPFIIEKLFSECGYNVHDFLTLIEPTPLCRYFYNDGIIFDNDSDRNTSIRNIRQFAPEDADAYSKFLDYSEELYKKTADAFLFNPLNSAGDLKKLNWIDLLRIDAFSTVSQKVDHTFSSTYLRKFFKRFTTYNGSSPYQAPATLNVIPHVELNQGGYYVQGGLYLITEALQELAQNLGVKIYFNQAVNSIKTDHKKVTAIETRDGNRHQADLIVANSDATDTLLNLLPHDSISGYKRKRQKNLEPSCSGFVLMLGCNRQWEQLKHHNIYFSYNYELEFRQIFRDRELPDDPTIYVANTSFTDRNHAPEGSSNLFILVNSPYLTDRQNWEKLSVSYRNHIIQELEKRGLKGLRDSIEVEKTITPVDFYKKYGSNRGSIYGTSSNSRFAAFLRPRNKLKEFENLFLVGGSTHPGGGIPLVIQSVFNAMAILDS
jgi:phytoene desaturase